MSEKLKFEIIEDEGVLRVKPENVTDFTEWVNDESNYPDSDSAFMELTESYSCNGWGIYTGDELGQLTQCIVICEESMVEDNGSRTLHGRAWSNNHNYQVMSPLREILERGYYDFYLWDTFKGENFPLI